MVVLARGESCLKNTEFMCVFGLNNDAYAHRSYENLQTAHNPVINDLVNLIEFINYWEGFHFWNRLLN